MKSQLQNQEILSNVPAAGLPGAESSRIAAAISRILLVHRATSGAAAASGRATDPRRDATPVEWALRMMF